MAPIPEDLKNAAQRTRKLSKEYVTKGDFHSLVGLYTEDCKLYMPPPLGFISGRAALRPICEAIYTKNKTVIEVQTQEIIYDGGDMAIEWASYTTPAGDTPHSPDISEGNVMCVWKKVDGQWLIYEETVIGSKPSIRTQLFELYMNWGKAFIAKDYKTAASLYTSDAVILGPGMAPVKGRPAAEKLFKHLHDHYGVHTYKMLPGYEVKEITANVVTLRAKYSAISTCGEEINKGGMFSVVKKQDDGSWLIQQEMYYIIPESVIAEPPPQC